MKLELHIEKKFRPEIEGLRAVAALLVATYHIWSGRVSGGVDVFFVVSGFLITLSLLNRLERDGKLGVPQFWLGLARRLFPAAFVVLFTVVIMSWLWLPQLQWSQTIDEIFASTFYYQNWQLASNAVDYLAQHNEASPVQHFWAMSVQGQFYILWPLLIIVSFMLMKLFKGSFKKIFLTIISGIFVLSFSYSIYKTATDQAWAYFDTFTRVWEFGLGSLLAVLGSGVVLRKWQSFTLGWIGLVAVVTCGVFLQVSTVFPGYAALWPTLSAVFIILAGTNGGKFGVHRILASKPLMKLGGLSYSLYLWHWPILVFYLILTGNEKVPLIDGLAIIAISIVLSYITTTFVEKPIRSLSLSRSRWKLGTVVASIMLPVLLVTSVWSYSVAQQSDDLATVGENEIYPGAMVFTEEWVERTVPEDVAFIPKALQAREDLPKMYNDGCHQSQREADVIECEYGTIENPDYTLALVGGSHSAHWLPALELIAESENILIKSYTKSSCRFTSTASDETCSEWNERLIEKLVDDKPDFVFTTADAGNRESVPKGYIDQWNRLNEAEIPVFAIRDNGWFTFDVPACIEEYPDTYMDECAVEREVLLPSESPWDKLEDKPENVYYADLTDYICEEDSCRPVAGNVLIYRDKHHLTTTYAKTLAPILYEELKILIH